MRLILDTDEQTLRREDNGHTQVVPLYTPQAFEWLSQQWLRVGWDQKYTYTFSWLGRPIIQLPEDMVRLQEVIYRLRPDVIVETGVAHGGSLVFHASLCKLLGKGRVIGIDVEIRSHNRRAIEQHELAGLITLIEGDSVDAAVVERVRGLVQPGETVLVLLDSCHTREHVLAELKAYAPLVTPGSYIVATDGLMRDLHDVPRARPGWKQDNPAEAARSFAELCPEFTIEEPRPPFSESPLASTVTHWPGAWLRRT
jgi:cephalosporin hydroxylase